MTSVRLQKYLSQEGILSRRKAETFIRNGWVLLNGITVTEMGVKINPLVDVVTISDDGLSNLEAQVTLAFHKPNNVLTLPLPSNERCIQDLLSGTYKDLSPVGRLDKLSEGLILLTNDGMVTKRVLSSDFPYAKIYSVRVQKPIQDSHIDEWEAGILLDNRMTKPCTIKRTGSRVIEIHLFEGRNRQIRRMMSHFGYHVHRLKRVAIGPIRLGDLVPGEFRQLSAADIRAILGSS